MGKFRKTAEAFALADCGGTGQVFHRDRLGIIPMDVIQHDLHTLFPQMQCPVIGLIRLCGEKSQEIPPYADQLFQKEKFIGGEVLSV